MRFVIIGAGDVGLSLCAKLVHEQNDVILVEKNEAKLAKLTSTLDVQVVIGNGCSPDVLVRAGLNTADYLISVADNDEVNIAACLISKLINPDAKRIARLRDINLVHRDIAPEHVREYFDLVVSPDRAGAEDLLQLFKVPGAKEVFEFANGRLQVLGLTVTPYSPLINKPLAHLREHRPNFPFLLIAIVRGSRLIVPRGTDTIHSGDVIYAISVPSKTDQLFELAGKEFHAGRSAMIWGGSGLGKHFAHALEAQGTNVKLIISDLQYAAELVDEFQSALVLSGDGTDHNLLLEENVADVDAFIAASAGEEDNILAALLAKRLGAKTVMALVNKAAYLPLVAAIGVDVVVSSRVAAASAIFRHIHARTVVSEFSLRYQGAGFIECIAAQDMQIVGIPLKDLVLPRGILISALVHEDEVVIPGGDDIIEPGDRVVIFVVQSALRRLEKMLRMKLELFST